MVFQPKRTVLITGGAGFIGSHLCGLFAAESFRVLCVDNFITGSQANIRPFSRDKNFSLIRHDISRPLRVPGRVGFVLHFASPASPPDYLKYPVQTLEAGSLGTRNALEIAREKKAVFCLASTSEVYGDPLVSPQPESYWGNVNPVGPRSVYDEAKRFAEALAFAYRRRRGVDAKVARIFNTYGSRMRPKDGRVIPNFVTQALLGKPLTVYGDGSQTRSYCYIDDLVDGLWRMIFSKAAGPVNLGNPHEMSVLKLAKVILRLTGSKSRLVYKPLPADDPKRRCPDIRLARRALGWTPKTGLEEGLRETIAYFRKST